MCRDAEARRLRASGVPLFFCQRGLTLAELITTLGLTVLVSTVGLSSFDRFIAGSRADTTILSLRTALALARTEAITRDASVVLCRRSDQLQQCAGSGASGRPDWSGGWLMFVDIDGDNALDTDSGDLILRIFPALNRTQILRWNRGDYIAYQGSGRLHSLNGTFCLGVVDGDADLRRELKIPYTGRVRITSGECSYTL